MSTQGILAAAVLVCLGCGDGLERDPVYPVTGTVTRDGAPLEGAVVTFHPVGDGQAAVGRTDASDRYSLTTWSQNDGAETGNYNVSIRKYDTPEGEPAAEAAPAETPSTDEFVEEYPEDYDEMEASEKAAAISKNILPPKYADPNTSGLAAEVAADGENVYDFVLDQ